MTPQQKFDLVLRAQRVALAELASGKTCIMVLYPNSTWGSYACIRLWGAFYQRYSDQHAGLKCLPVETLILVASDADGWDAEGLALAKTKLQAQGGKTILITRAGI